MAGCSWQAMLRHVADQHTMQVHDTSRETKECRLGDIKAEHRVWFVVLDDARLARFRDCAHCIGEQGIRAKFPVHVTLARP